MRTFIALNIPFSEPLKLLYNDIRENCAGLNIKYTDPEQNHITLYFLGETNSNVIEKLHCDFSGILLGYHKIETELRGLGVFKSIKRPEVLWIGLNINSKLIELHEKISQITYKYGFVKERPNFAPHCTIGRIKKVANNNNLSEFLNKYHNVSFGKLEIKEFVFYESILKPEGTRYNVLYKYPLI